MQRFLLRSKDGVVRVFEDGGLWLRCGGYMVDWWRWGKAAWAMGASLSSGGGVSFVGDRKAATQQRPVPFDRRQQRLEKVMWEVSYGCIVSGSSPWSF
jgi:hypothetical protein